MAGFSLGLSRLTPARGGGGTATASVGSVPVGATSIGGNGTAGATLTVTKGGTSIGTATVSNSGTWSLTLGSAAAAGDVYGVSTVAVPSAAATTVYGTLGPTTASFSTTAASGAQIAAFTGLTGRTATGISPNDGRVALNAGGTALVVGLTASSVGTTSYAVSFSDGSTLNVAVTASAGPALNALSLDVTRIATGVPFTSNILGGQAGSTYTLSGAGATGLSVTGSKITGTPTAAATNPVHVTETASDGTTTRTTSAVATVASPVRQLIVGTPQFPSIAVANTNSHTQTQMNRPYPVLRSGVGLQINAHNFARTVPDGTIAGPSNITLRHGVSSAYNVAGAGINYSGARDLALTPSQVATSDTLAQTKNGGAYVSGDYVYASELCTYATAPANFPGQRSLPLTNDGDLNESGTALTDRTTAAWSYVKSYSSYLFNHILGITALTAGGPVVGIAMNSIGSDTFNDNQYGFFPGWVQQGLARAGIPSCNVGISSQALSGYVSSATQNATNWAAFLAMMQANGVTHVLPAGTNDLNNGSQTGAQVYANLGVLKNKLDAVGIKLIPVTLLPRTNAGNTADASSPSVNPTELAAFNTLVRNNNGVGYGYYDAYAIMADPGATPNRWRTDIYGATAFAVASGGTGMTSAAIEFEFAGTAAARATVTSGAVTAFGARRPGGLLASELPANPVSPTLVYSTGNKATQPGTGVTANITWTLASPTADGTHPAAAHAEFLARDFAAKAASIFGA